MKKLIFSVILVGIILFTYFVSRLAITPQSVLPQSGVWRCEQLQMELSFQKKPSFVAVDETVENRNESLSFVMIEGEHVGCYAHNDKGSKNVYIHCREKGNKYFYEDQTICVLQHLSINEREWVLQDEGGQQYKFVRIE